MRILHAASELRPRGRKVCVAIGMFDGVHLGHQQIIRQTVADARQHEGLALVVTFDRHPDSVVAPLRAPRLIYSLPQKLRAIEPLGADAVLLIAFDRPFSEQPGEVFVRRLAQDVGRLASICVGADFVFGHHRSGNVALLRKLGRELNFAVHGLAAVSLDGQPVRSTRIRAAIAQGRLDAASQMLGRTYALAGRVVRGEAVGRKLGFPTANVDVTGLVLPPNGVYAVHVQIVGRQIHRGVLNIGYRPTVQPAGRRLSVEVHLLDFEGELYGEELEMAFVAKLRNEKKFPSLAALRTQIGRDIAQARGRF